MTFVRLSTAAMSARYPEFASAQPAIFALFERDLHRARTWLAVRWIAIKGEIDYRNIIRRQITAKRYCGSIRRRDCVASRFVTQSLRLSRLDLSRDSMHELIKRVRHVRLLQHLPGPNLRNSGKLHCGLPFV